MRPLFFCLTLLMAYSCNRISNTDTPPPTPTAITTTVVEDKIKALGITLKTPAPPLANYVNAVRTGNLIFLAGKGPRKPEGGNVTGKVGQDLTIEEGYQAARLAAIAQLGALKAEIGNLDKVTRIVKVRGMVNCTNDFTQQPEVINGYSDLMVEVFGDKGKHARAAVGHSSLPRNIAVEVEMVVEMVVEIADEMK